MSSLELDTRERILKETWDLMAKRRGQGVRIEDIAQAAGVSRQAVYMHFGSRSGLLIATARYVDEVLGCEQRLMSVRTASSSIAMLEAYVEFWGNYIPDIYGLAKALMTVRETDAAAAAAWEDRMRDVYQACVTTVQCLVRDGELSPELSATEAAELFFAMLAIPIWEILTIERGWSIEQYIERMQHLIKRALLKAE